MEHYDRRKILDELDKHSIYDVPSISELNDGSWEMVVLKSYYPILKDKLSKTLPGSIFDPNYDPIEPGVNDVEYYGYNTAKALYMYWFLGRAKRMIEDSWFIAAAYYSYRVERARGTGVRCRL